MSNKIIGLLFVTAVVFSSCKEDCVTCSGTTFPHKVCRDDYAEKSDYEKYISEYQEEEEGVCE